MNTGGDARNVFREFMSLIKAGTAQPARGIANYLDVKLEKRSFNILLTTRCKQVLRIHQMPDPLLAPLAMAMTIGKSASNASPQQNNRNTIITPGTTPNGTAIINEVL